MSKPGIRFPHFIAAVTIFALLAVGQATAAEPIDAADAVRVPDAGSVTDASDLVASPAVASTSAAPASATTDSLVERIVDQVDRLYRSTTSHSRLEMLIVNLSSVDRRVPGRKQGRRPDTVGNFFGQCMHLVFENRLGIGTCTETISATLVTQRFLQYLDQFVTIRSGN